MAEQGMGPERLTAKGLPTARRGYDHKAVERLLEEARRAWTELQQEHRRFLAEIEQAGGLDYLSRDLGAIGAEVGQMLGDAQGAARGLRERARADSEARLAAAAAEAGRLVSEAEEQAFHVRADAWATGTDLLRQTVETGRAMIREAGADALSIRAEAEQEAHRLVASARRESQDLLREARFAAERSMLEARAQMEQVVPIEIPAPASPTETSPPAASGRRRRRAPEVAPTEVPDVIRVIPPEVSSRAARPAVDPGSYGDALAAEVEALWESGEVQAVPEAPLPPPPAHSRRRGKGVEQAVPPVEAPEPAAEPPVEQAPVAAGPVGGSVVGGEAEASAPVEAEVVPAAPDEPVTAAPPEPASEIEAVAVEPEVRVVEPAAKPAVEAAVSGGEPAPGVVEELFARLRTTHRPGRRRKGAVPGDETLPGLGPPATLPTARGPAPDALELRERLVLPVQNRALRRVKENLLELQNAALDSLRTSGAWEGAGPALAVLAPALDPVGEEGAEAGAQAAAAFTGGEPPAAVIGARSAALVQAMADELAAQVDAALAEAAAAGPLEVAAAVSRVFRAWRADEAEHWVRTVAYAAYHDSLLAGLAVAGVKQVSAVSAGLLCAECPAFHKATWDPAGEPPAGVTRPPANSRCVCTVAPA